jgi:effector-binding domain-containing protein
MKSKLLALALITGITIVSCGEKKEEKKEESKEENKEEVKEEPAYAYTYEVTEEEVPGGWKLSITTENVTVDKIGETLESSYGAIFAFLTKTKKEMGIPFAISHEWMNESTPFTLEAAIPVMDSTIKAKAPLVLGKSYKGKALKVTYFGDYSKMKPAYDDIIQYMSEKKYANNGSPWEVYVTDPAVEKDTTKWQTDIYMPIK